MELAGYESINLVLIGGVVRKQSYVASGHMADEALAGMYADFAFVGIDGAEVKTGYTVWLKGAPTLPL